MLQHVNRLKYEKLLTRMMRFGYFQIAHHQFYLLKVIWCKAKTPMGQAVALLKIHKHGPFADVIEHSGCSTLLKRQAHSIRCLLLEIAFFVILRALQIVEDMQKVSSRKLYCVNFYEQLNTKKTPIFNRAPSK